MSAEFLKPVVFVLFIFAALRSLFRISQEGWAKPFLTLAIGVIVSVAVQNSHGPSSLILSIIIGLFALLFFTRPSLHVRLTKRVRKVVRKLTAGLDLQIQTEVIPIEKIREDLRSEGMDESKALTIINAFAGKVDGSDYIFMTPGAASLAENELAFIAAHEIGHHMLGHTKEGLFDMIQKVVSTNFGEAIAWPIGAILKHLVGPQRSQSHEFAADAWAIQHLESLNLDARGGILVLGRFAQGENDTFLVKLSNKLFGSHPPAAVRCSRVQKLIKS